MKNKIQFVKLLLLSMLFLAIGITIFDYGIDTLNQFIPIFYSGVGSLALVSMVSVPRAESGDRAGNQTKYRIYVLHYDTEVDIENVPLPDKIAQTLADIPRIAGKYWHYIDANVNTVIPKFSTGDDGLLVANSVEIKFGGLSTAARLFLNNYKGETFYVVWEVCSGADAGSKYIAGTKCSGMLMTISDGGWLAEMTGATIVFKNSCPDIPYKYMGNTTLSTPTEIAANAVTQAIEAGQNEYKFTDNTAPKSFTGFTGLTEADHGRIVTLFGGNTDEFPTTIAPSATVLLYGGAIWSANAGSKISFSIFWNDDSGVLIEVKGSIIQT